MPRRNRYKRSLGYLAGGVAVVGVLGWAIRSSVEPARKPVALETGPVAAGVNPRGASTTAPDPGNDPHNKTAAGAIPKRVVLFDIPATRPSGVTLAPKPAPTVAVDAANLFKGVDAALAADDLLGARDELVAALDARKFSESERDAAFERLQKTNDTVVFSDRKFAKDAHQIAYTVAAGDNMQKIANKFDVTVGFLQRLNHISDPRKLRLGASLKIVRGPFHAVVNKTAFTLDLYQGPPGQTGSVFLKRLRVGLGESDSTPTGLWKIGTKLIDPTYYNSRDTGPRVIASGDKQNPLGERWLALEGMSGQAVGKESYGIHGTIDPTSIGQKKSMGCVRLLNEDVNLVYDMLIKDKSTVTVVE